MSAFDELLESCESIQKLDVKCCAVYGRPFSEVVEKLRLDDLKSGIESGKYRLIMAYMTDRIESGPVANVEFKCQYGSNLKKMSLLYEGQPEADVIGKNFVGENFAACRSWLTPRFLCFKAELRGQDAFDWAKDAMRKARGC